MGVILLAEVKVLHSPTYSSNNRLFSTLDKFGAVKNLRVVHVVVVTCFYRHNYCAVLSSQFET